MRHVVTAFVAVALAGCASAPGDVVDSGVESGVVESGVGVVESGVGVVAVGCVGATSQIGSGISVDTPGRVVTTAHTVAGATSITVVDARGAEFAAAVVAFDKDADLALLDAPGLAAPPLAVGRSEVGQAVAVVWSPDEGVRALPVTVTRRLAITIEDIYVDDEVERSGIELAGDISNGDSGGAIVDRNGDVVGIVYAKSRARTQTAFATDDVELTRLLAERPLDPTDRCR